jgi:peptidyl-tRNA hydrolase
MANIRHTVIVRRDLQMPVGLLAAQVSHICDAFMRKIILSKSEQDGVNRSDANPNEMAWCSDPYLSVLAANCYEDLCEIQKQAEREDLPVKTWHDLIPSPTFPDRSIKAFVGLSIGPADFDLIKIVTGGLELY